MFKILFLIPLILIAGVVFISCDQDKKILVTKENYVTSEAGDKIAEKKNISFVQGQAAEGNIIRIHPSVKKQEIDGIGSSFTESSAFVLAHLDKQKRQEVMEKIFSDKGANFSLNRTHIGSCDFSVEGKYSYLDKKGRY